MSSQQVTDPAEPAGGAAQRRLRGWRRRSARLRAGAVLIGISAAGCVSVKAPEEPIVIELNVNIRQEVVYRLAPDAGTTIQQNPEIF